MSAIDDLPPLREVIRRHALAARKSLGQNFLLDLNLTARIARAAGPLDSATVVEIGAGPGGLTRALLAEGAKRVIAVERDLRAIAALAEIAARYPQRLTIIEGDALALDLAALIEGARPARIVANLPYNIATALLVRWPRAALVPTIALSAQQLFSHGGDFVRSLHDAGPTDWISFGVCVYYTISSSV